MTKPTNPFCTILLVDDISENLHRLENFLLGIESGIRVLKATSASQVINYLLVEPIDIALLDHNLPDMGGVELAQIVRQFGQHIVIYLMGVLEYPSDIAAEELASMESAGITAYISKPVDLKILFDLIKDQQHHKPNTRSNTIQQLSLVNLGQMVAPPKPMISTKSLFPKEKDLSGTWCVGIQNLLAVERIAPLNLIFLVDSSHSMLQHTLDPNTFHEHNNSTLLAEKIIFAEATCQLVKDLIQCIPNDSRFSLMAVNHTVQMMPTTEATEQAKNEANTLLDGLIFQGGTDLHLGLEALLERAEEFTNLQGIPQIILWTDSDISASCLERCISSIQKLVEAGFVLHCVNFAPLRGLEYPSEVLQELAGMGSGQCINVGLIDHAIQNLRDTVWSSLGLCPEKWLTLKVVSTSNQYGVESICVGNLWSADRSWLSVAPATLHSYDAKLYITLDERIWDANHDEIPRSVAQVCIRPFIDKNAFWKTISLSLDDPVNAALGTVPSLSPLAPPVLSPPIFRSFIFKGASHSIAQDYLAEVLITAGHPQLAERVRQFVS